MRSFLMVVVVWCWGLGLAWADQPYGIELNPSGVSRIYPVVDVSGWTMTQPDYSRIYTVPDQFRVTHFGDDYYAQDWARGCGKTHGQRLYAGISGQVVLAGPRGPYGQTVVIYDADSRFALKYSHLSEVHVSEGEWVLAGKSFLGRVGNTGNIQSSGCQSRPGSHLHISLHKNVADPRLRPITSTYAASGAGPTNFAAPFEYAFSVELVKTYYDPTVYAFKDWRLYPVSAKSFETHGWNFDQHNLLIRPVAAQASLPGSREYFFWPVREGVLVKTSISPQIYIFQDERKFALTYEEFNCRGLRFGEVREFSPDERDRYEPVQDRLARNCKSPLRWSLGDWANFFRTAPQFSGVDWSGYVYYPDWDNYWELRSLRFRHSSGQLTNIYRINLQSDPQERYLGYFHPGTGEWSGWQRIF